MAIHKNLTTINRTLGKYKKFYILLHYTGNHTDTAKANTDYFKSVNRGASADYFSGNDGIYMCVNPQKAYAWHCGKDYSSGKAEYWGIVTNKNSIGIEMCSVNGEITEKTFNQTVALVKKLMKKYNIPESNILRHYDVCHKQCPGWKGWLPPDETLWKKFKQELSPSSKPLAKVTPESKEKYIRWVQKKLEVAADGIYGQKTMAAVAKYKKNNNFDNQSGKVVGIKMIKQLNKSK
ncbi:MAG: N-acetylmuramoyl-L-alanine amidase [Lachnospiraceae bacterium]|nr:N-acetylmuramoyl-L-alanine amidase [Lachnospiraceae bacterium]